MLTFEFVENVVSTSKEKKAPTSMKRLQKGYCTCTSMQTKQCRHRLSSPNKKRDGDTVKCRPVFGWEGCHQDARDSKSGDAC